MNINHHPNFLVSLLIFIFQSLSLDGNRSRWADRSGRRGGPSHRLGNNQRSGHSKSPPSSSQSFSTRRRARTPPPSHRRVTPTLQHRTTIQREQRDTNGIYFLNFLI